MSFGQSSFFFGDVSPVPRMWAFKLFVSLLRLPHSVTPFACVFAVKA